jgi:hypothetical protein
MKKILTVAAVATLIAPLAAFAQSTNTPSATGHGMGVGGGRFQGGMHVSTTTRAMNLQKNIQNREQQIRNGADKEITNRIDSLTQLLTRIASTTKITSAEQQSLTSTIQTEITSLQTLEQKVQSDTSTSSLSTDRKSITDAYRVYALVIPQVEIITSADRIETVAQTFSTVVGKINTRIASSTVDTTKAQADVTDINAKLADATSQAQAAIALVANLKPDQGVQSVATSNTQALKSARADLKTAESDLRAAEKDARDALAALRIKVAPQENAPSTATSSSTQ